MLCIHGSGPLDRNENLPVQRMDIFNTVAADLAPRGIATLRYDKRGCGRSTGKYYTASYGDLVGDVVAAMRFLRSAEGGAFRRIVLLGHSEGTIIAASVAASGGPLDGLVLLAPFVERSTIS
ncbi:MAG: alpha/beta fold hydrolase [Bauldia sp.]|nr:alpha/beta fold hydrolase [Bauldia sp.]